MSKINGVVSIYSNSPSQPTGYGQQADYLVQRLKRDGADVAALSNYGLEGTNSTYMTQYGEIPHYARGMDGYSNDVAVLHHNHWKAKNPNKPDVLLGLYDCWVIQGKQWDDVNIGWWTPLDHVTMPPKVQEFLIKPNVTPIAMSPHGVRQMNSLGIECEYVPHGIDTKIYKPTDNIEGQSTRDYMGLKDEFIVGMVAANKASGMVHRKAFSESLLAFSIFRQKHSDAVLYLHTEPFGIAGGWNLIKMLEAFGIPQNAVIFPNYVDYKYGIPQPHLAALYSAMDVLLAPSYGEGFGVPTVEALACGTRVIGSSWAATPDLLSEDSFMVEGQPMWDAGQNAIWEMPLVSSLVAALEEAYKADRGTSKTAVDFAQQFDVDTVWEKHWMPVWKKLLK